MAREVLDLLDGRRYSLVFTTIAMTNRIDHYLLLVIGQRAMIAIEFYLLSVFWLTSVLRVCYNQAGDEGFIPAGVETQCSAGIKSGCSSSH